MKSLSAGLLMVTLAAGVLHPGPAFAADPAPLVFTGAGPWDIDFGECVLRRKFASPGGEATLEIRTPAPMLNILLAGPGVALRNQPTFTRFAPGDRASVRVPATFGAARGVTAVVMIAQVPLEASWLAAPRAPSLAPAPGSAEVERALAEIRELHLTQGKTEVIVQHGPLKAPLAELAQCRHARYAEQVAGSDLPVPAHPPIARNSADWRAEYPTAALRKGVNGVVTMVVKVGTTGMPESCRAKDQNADASLIKEACGVMMRTARFDPARDAAGQPVRSNYVNTMTFSVPGF